jgi:hypothetical protein
MSGEDYPGGCPIQAASGGEWFLSPHADEDREDEEEDETADCAIGYGSLLSLGTALRKKRPSLVLDPDEAEDEARRVQLAAARQFIGEDAPDPDPPESAIAEPADGEADRDAPPEPSPFMPQDHDPPRPRRTLMQGFSAIFRRLGGWLR